MPQPQTCAMPSIPHAGQAHRLAIPPASPSSMTGPPVTRVLCSKSSVVSNPVLGDDGARGSSILNWRDRGRAPSRGRSRRRARLSHRKLGRLCLVRRPPGSQRLHRLRMLRPVVEGGRVEIRAVRPDQCMRFGIDLDLREKTRVVQRAVEIPTRIGPRSMTRSRPSSNVTLRPYGPTMLNCTTR